MNIRTGFLPAMVVIVAAAAGGSCTHKKGDAQPVSACSTAGVKYASGIAPILTASCAANIGCHGAGSANGPGALTNYAQASAASASIKDAVVAKRMPLGSPLSYDDVKKIMCWVDSGAPNN